MTATFGILVFLTIAAVMATIVWPLVGARRDRPAGRAGHRAAAQLRQRADLLAVRNSIYRALQELDFDHETNKVSDEDYAVQRYRLVAQGVAVLQQLDTLPAPAEDDAIEEAVGAFRGEEPVSETDGRYCPTCGVALAPGDKFCGACGARLG